MSVKLVIKHLDFCSVLLWWTGHSVGFLNVFCVLFYGEFLSLCEWKSLEDGNFRPVLAFMQVVHLATEL